MIKLALDTLGAFDFSGMSGRTLSSLIFPLTMLN
jgi:hypothetical protein